MATASVRPAVPSDVAEIVRIQATTWATAYGDVLPESAIEHLRGDQARDAWTAAVEASPGHVLVAVEGDWTVGFCAAATATAPADARPDEDAPDLGPQAWGEIGVLLVEPRWGRRGHGGRLLAAAAEALRHEGGIFGLAWVPETDAASRGFYARAGWEADGTVRGLDTGGSTLRELRLTGSLDLRLQD